LRFDIIYDAVGTSNSREQALNLIKSGGLIMHIGLSEINKGINFLKLTRNEVKLIGSYAYTNKEFKNSLTMISKNKLGNLSWKSFTNLKKDEHIIRLHIGLEDPNDIIEDLRQALKKIK